MRRFFFGLVYVVGTKNNCINESDGSFDYQNMSKTYR